MKENNVCHGKEGCDTPDNLLSNGGIPFPESEKFFNHRLRGNIPELKIDIIY
jgi:hypothetical protein